MKNNKVLIVLISIALLTGIIGTVLIINQNKDINNLKDEIKKIDKKDKKKKENNILINDEESNEENNTIKKEGKRKIRIIDQKYNIDFQVCNKKNDFYESECLGKNYSYIANLIEKINIDINYDVKMSDDILKPLVYSITGLLVFEKDGENLFEKEYKFKENAKVTNNNEITVEEQLSLNYEDYLNDIRDFTKNYEMEANVTLIITFDGYINTDEDKITIEKKEIRIPITNKAKSIKIEE